MARVKRGTTVRQKHNKILERAKGYLGRHSTTYRAAREKTEKAGQYAYRDRRDQKIFYLVTLSHFLSNLIIALLFQMSILF